MTERELRDWCAFQIDHPLPDELADLHSALLCSVVANIARGSDSAPFRLTDFLMLKPSPDEVVELSEAERFRQSLGS